MPTGFGPSSVESLTGSRLVRAERWALFLCAAAAAALVGPRGPVYWDAFGYIQQALNGNVGGLALGRPLFVLVSHAIARGLLGSGLSVWHVEPCLRASWIAVSATAAPAVHALAAECGLSRRAALLAGLVTACSPAVAHTSAGVMTDGPAVALMTWTVVIGARAAVRASIPLALGAGAMAGVAFGIREQSIVCLASLALMLPVVARGRRASLAIGAGLAAIVGIALPMAFVVWTQPGYVGTIAGWIDGMRFEHATHAYSFRDAGLYLLWIATLGPVIVPAAAAAWFRRPSGILRPWGLLAAIAVPALVELAALAIYPDISYSPRYLLTTFPGALAIPGAIVLDRWIADSRARLALVTAGLLVPLIAGAPIVRAESEPFLSTVAALPGGLLALPDRAVIVTGAPCPAIPLVADELRIDGATRGRAPDWQTVCPGWAWPGDLAVRLDAAIAEGRLVVLDLRRSSWSGQGQLAHRALAETYAAARESQVKSGRIRVWGD